MIPLRLFKIFNVNVLRHFSILTVFVLWHIQPIVFSTSWTYSKKLTWKLCPHLSLNVSHFALKNQTKFIIREIRSVKTLINFACSGTVTFSANCFFLHLESALPKSTKICVFTSVWMFCILLLKIRQKLVIWEIRSVMPLIYFACCCTLTYSANCF